MTTLFQVSLLTLLSLSAVQADQEPSETALLVNGQPLDLEWTSCANLAGCLKSNVIERVADLEGRIGRMGFGPVARARGFQINLGETLKMKMISKDGRWALRFLANEHQVDQSRGHFAEKQKIALIGFSMILFVLGVVSTTLKVNVFLALLGVAVGKILLLYVYTEHLIHHGHKHHPHHGIHIHKAPVHHYKYSPVHVEPVPIIEQEIHHHDPYHHHHEHDDWIFGRKKKSMQL